ncbi:long-chain-fatty-acid CoA ligase [Sulfurihydrogenibium azorense Az-Fu1]|uniref:Long-chain-fatty-acid CoA ligase n=1 Tax=Sulfurihydrogenibium azorense (strain DSM 15241 / OCM 825 / Az-Fu1) TaxID=204536 RepID=C1DUS2_SULAA|nr:AMP-binding protein [Sulfurihydrogenibium azorense]ACN98387.1 long-chain-fatty-acid CoA ligase [Sulfurihydrogenibium azorense Az-Fu1]
MITIKPSDKTALIYAGEKISYHQLLHHIDVFSSLLEVSKEDKVAIFSENRPEWIYTFFAVWKKAAVNVPIDFMSNQEELLYILQDCKPKVIFTSKNNKEKVISIKEKLDYDIQVFVFEELDFKSKGESKEVEKDLEDVAVILYTSGTTGNPKGVMLTYKNILSNVRAVEKVGIASEKDSTLALLPFHHSYPLVVSMIIPLNLQATIVFLDKLTPEDILEKLKTYKVSILIAVPRVYSLFHRRIFQEINKSSLTKTVFKVVKTINYQPLSRLIFKKVHQVFGGNIKYFVSGGSKLDLEVAKDLWALGFKVVEGYGLTETSPIVSFNPPDKIKLGSVGKPIEGVEVKILDGEILVKGDNVFKGYYNKPLETQSSFKDGYFMTGDLGYLDDEGYLYITGRKKEIIVLPNGKNINPEEIENHILKMSDIVKEVAVIEKDNSLFAIIYPDFEAVKKKGIVNLEETIKWNVIDKYNLTQPPYKRIGGFKIVNQELPKTRLGKIRRFMLKDFLEKSQEKPRQIKEPDSQVYQILKDYLKSYTNLPVYPDSHIEIDLALDSLGKVELLTFIETTFGVSITEKDLAQNPTVESLYKLIEEIKTKIETQTVNLKEILNQESTAEIKEGFIIYLKPILKTFFKIYNNLQVEGLENIKEKPVIFAPNHQSYLDGFLLIASLPNDILKDTYFLAEETYFNSAFRRFIAKNFNVIPVNINKNLKDSLIKSAAVIKSGKNLVIFPEGARTRDGSLLPFKKGFAILSKELNIPVIPTVISGAFESYPINAKIPKPYPIKVKFLEAVYPDNLSYDEITDLVKNKIQHTINF